MSILLRFFIFTIRVVLFIIVGETYLLALNALLNGLLYFEKMDT